VLPLSPKHLVLLALACSTSFRIHAQALPDQVQQHIQHVVSGLLPAVVIKDQPQPTHTLSERMKEMHVPGVSIAVIHNGDIEWAQGFGEAAIGGPPVTAETIFQAGRAVMPVDAKVLATYPGTYEMTPQFALAISLDDGHLSVQATGQPKLQLFAESRTRFFLTEVDAEIEFISDNQGKVTTLILHQGGHDSRALRK
jgi:hypothetical protein